MWEPEPGWTRLPGGMGASTVGVWRDGDRVAKRLRAPLPDDPHGLSDPSHFSWWRRAAAVALAGVVTETLGLRSAPVLGVEEDTEGITLWHAYVEPADLPGPFLARALGRFAGNDVPDVGWLARHQLSARLAHVERRGGWTTLARTTVADVADRLWQRRTVHLARLAELPQVLQHGDPVPANFVQRKGDDVVALDWGTLGVGPAGGDLGYLALSAREAFPVLTEAYADGLPPGTATAEEVVTGASVNAVYTALTRADWALARVADGPGALAGKYRHPSVAPYLRSLQRLFPQLEALL